MFKGCAGRGNVAFIMKVRNFTAGSGRGFSPLNAHEFLLGLETLPCDSIVIPGMSAVARWLKEHPHVSWVAYPD